MSNGWVNLVLSGLDLYWNNIVNESDHLMTFIQPHWLFSVEEPHGHKSRHPAQHMTLVSMQGHHGATGAGGAWGLMAFPTPLAWSGYSSHCSCVGRRKRGLALRCSNRGQIVAVGTFSGINLDRRNKASSKTWSTQDSWPETFPTGQVPLPLPKEKKKEKIWDLFFFWKRLFQIHLQRTEPFVLKAINSHNSPKM